MARRGRLQAAAVVLLTCAALALAAATRAGFPREQGEHVPPSTACALAGGWCPAAVLGSTSRSPSSRTSSSARSSSGSGSGSGSEASGVGQHKALWPLGRSDWLGLGVAVLALALAATGGIGGGAILVPLYLMVLGFSTAGAVALSNVTIVGGTLANLGFNVGRRHPLAPARPLVDWDLILMMEPSTILGALAGGYVNKVLPGWLTTVSLALLLTLITFKTAAKAADLRSKERRIAGASLRRLAVLDAEGGDMLVSIHSPLLDTPRGSDVSSEGGFAPPPLPPRLALSPQDAAGVAPGALAAASSSLAYEEAGQAAAVGPADADAAVRGGDARASSLPLPIGTRQGSAALPMLTPILVPPETRLSSAERQKILAAAAGLGGAAPHEGAAATSPPGRTWPYKAPQPGRSSSRGSSRGGGSGSKAWPGSWRPYVPVGKLAVLLALLAGVVASDLAKMHAACPSLAYWLRAAAMAPVTLVALLAVRHHLLRKGAVQRATGYEALDGDVAWTPRTTLVYPAACTAAGLCAGVFGVGGGIIKAPLMLEMGVLPEVAAATSATMILFTSMSASVVFISFGAVQWDYAAAAFALGVAATVAGQLLVMWASRHLQSRSLLVAIMASVLGISCVALAVQGAQATVAAARAGTLWQLHDVCGKVAQ